MEVVYSFSKTSEREASHFLFPLFRRSVV